MPEYGVKNDIYRYRSGPARMALIFCAVNKKPLHRIAAMER